MSSLSRQQLEEWLKYSTKIPSNKKVIDIGGSQNPVKDRISYSEGTEFAILDLEKPHELKQQPDIVADLNYPEKGFLIKNYDYAGKTKDYFDVAFCLEVSEYWWNPVEALKTINGLIKTGGLLYISFHFIYPVHNPVDQDYLRYTPNGAIKLLEETGFRVVGNLHRILGDETNYKNLINSEKMRPARSYVMHNAVGSLITARKI